MNITTVKHENDDILELGKIIAALLHIEITT